MALHFDRLEFDARLLRTRRAIAERGLDAMLIFAQESMYWLTGFDSFGYCFFQCMVLRADGGMTLLTRAPDLRQARHTSILTDIRVWVDDSAASPAVQLCDLGLELGLMDAEIGVEYDTHGLTAANGRAVDAAFSSIARLVDASDLIPRLRAIKSPQEIDFARKAGALADAALHAGLGEIAAGAHEADILAAMQSAVLKGGGDYPGNEFIIGSGADALLCRYKSGRRRLSDRDQITLEFAGVWRHYHAALMRTVIVGAPQQRHRVLHAACLEALAAVEETMRPGAAFGDVFAAHAGVLDGRGLAPHRLNACGYSLGARFAPSWMDWPMFYRGNRIEIVPDMILFSHMVVMDSDSGVAMCVGRTYLTTAGAPEPLSAAPLDLPIR